VQKRINITGSSKYSHCAVTPLISFLLYTY
jgi:hypothetical protein